MKLNATSEMLPITWETFGGIHPFAPLDQAEGYRQLTSELEAMLCACTGYDAVSLQPNSGAQGEFAGLLAIRDYHASRGEDHRNVCLIPSSAHGTNSGLRADGGPESGRRAMRQGRQCRCRGSAGKAEKHGANLAALMITYPSTHGVFEEAITEICEVVHQHGGQVYSSTAPT